MGSRGFLQTMQALNALRVLRVLGVWGVWGVEGSIWEVRFSRWLEGRLLLAERGSGWELLLETLLALLQLCSFELDLSLDLLPDDQLSALLFNFRQSNQ